MRPENCYDCDRPARGWGLDISLSYAQWKMIVPEDEQVILCPGCIALRAAKIPGAHYIHASIEIVPVKDND